VSKLYFQAVTKVGYSHQTYKRGIGVDYLIKSTPGITE